jgi:Tfp pilus assembly protein PilN
LRQYNVDKESFPEPKDLVSSVSLSCNEFGISAHDITLCIPKAWTIVRTAQFPSTARQYISEAISYELDRLTPLSSNQALYDHVITGDDGQTLTVLIMAARTDKIVPYIDALAENGFSINRITVDISAVGTLCHHLEKKDCTVFVAVDEKGYEGALFRNGSILEVFSNSSALDNELDLVSSVSQEVSSLVALQEKQGSSPLVVAFLRDKSSGLRESIKLRLGRPLTFIEDTVTGFVTKPSHSGTGTRSNVISYAAIGSMLQSLLPGDRKINLLTKGLRKKEKTPIALTTMLLIGLALAWVIYLVMPVTVEGRRLDELSRQIALKQQDIRNIESLKNKIDDISSEIASIESFREERPLAVDIIRDLTLQLPMNAWLTKMLIAETYVRIEGNAASATVVLPALEASRHFTGVEFASPTYRDTRMRLEKFIIRMQLESSKDYQEEESRRERK